MKIPIKTAIFMVMATLLCLLGGCQSAKPNESSVSPEVGVSSPNIQIYDESDSGNQYVLIPHSNTIIAGKNSISMLGINGDVWEYRGTIDEMGRLSVEKIVAGRNVQTLYINDMPGNFTYCIAVDDNGKLFDAITGEDESTTKYFNRTDSLVVDYSATFDHAMILLDDGSLWAYGENYEGAINGECVSDYLYEPIKVADNIKSVATANFHTLAIKDDGTLWGWGDDSYGQLARCGKLSSFMRPIEIMENVKYIFASERESFVVTTDDILWGWGENTSGLIDFGSSKPCYTPVQIINDVEKFVTDIDHPNCAFIVKTDGSLWAYRVGCLGDGERTSEFKSPIKIMDSVVDISTYEGLTIALKEDGTVWWWGDAGNSFHNSEYLSPTQLLEGIQLPK